MTTKDESLLVKVIKKAVGLPAANSSCGCGTRAGSTDECCKTEAAKSSTTDCGCGSTVAQEEETPTEA
jgi:hypothetical protein